MSRSSSEHGRDENVSNYFVECLGKDRIILKWILRSCVLNLWAELIWFRVKTSGGILWTLQYTFRFRKKQRIKLAERLSSQEERCSIELPLIRESEARRITTHGTHRTLMLRWLSSGMLHRVVDADGRFRGVSCLHHGQSCRIHDAMSQETDILKIIAVRNRNPTPQFVCPTVTSFILDHNQWREKYDFKIDLLGFSYSL